MPHFVNFVRILPLFLLNVNDFYIYVVLVAHYIYWVYASVKET